MNLCDAKLSLVFSTEAMAFLGFCFVRLQGEGCFRK